MKGRWIILVAVAALTASGCGEEPAKRASPSPTPAAAERKTVIRDAKLTVIQPVRRPRSTPVPTPSPATPEDYRKALDEATRAIKLDRKNTEALQMRGEAKRELGDGSGSIRDYGRAIALSPQDPLLYLERARSSFRSGDNRMAHATWHTARTAGSSGDSTSWQSR